MLQEICKIISENWLIVKGQNSFKHDKYILVAEKEKAEITFNMNWEGRLTHLKSYFDERGLELDSTMRQIQSEHRDEIFGLESKVSNKVKFLLYQMSNTDLLQDNYN